MRRLSNARAQVPGAASDIPVIFDREGLLADGGGISGVQSSARALDADLVSQGVVANGRLQINGGTSYIVRDIRPHGPGLSVVLLGTA